MRPVADAPNPKGQAVNPEIIEAMCRAYWNERGTFKWENEGEQYKEAIRQRMRAAVDAQQDYEAEAMHERTKVTAVEDLL